MPADADDLAAYLADRRGVRVTVTVPERGEKRRLVALATQNAVEALQRERTEWMADAARRDEALTDLARELELPRPPERIECYDMSNIQGTSAVGSMVVFIDGKPEPREYRRFRIRSGDTPDDFRMMAEVLRRRFSRVARLRSETGALSLAAVGADEAPEGEREDGGLLDLEPNGGPIDDEAAEVARPRDRRRGEGPALRGGRGALGAGDHRRAPHRPRQAVRGAPSARSVRPGRAAASVAGALPRAAHPR
jgi:hypothetical protein